MRTTVGAYGATVHCQILDQSEDEKRRQRRTSRSQMRAEEVRKSAVTSGCQQRHAASEEERAFGMLDTALRRLLARGQRMFATYDISFSSFSCWNQDEHVRGTHAHRA